ncbi:MAG: nodulation protein NfeD [Chloroflexi bacterium]|nr:nodulation protein NfeD [Chloroflexota bacterium]
MLGALLLIGLVSGVAPVTWAQDSAGPVFVVQIRDEIDLGLAPYLARVLEQAKRENARAVILEIDTPGGRLDAALQMRAAILASPVRTIAFVNRSAFSAGALIAIAANGMYLAPGAVIGAATPVTGTGTVADEKVVSAVRNTFKSTAEHRGRDPRVAEAMVDPAVAIDGLVARGQLLALTTAEAQTWGYADGVAQDRQELLQVAGLSGAAVHETSPALAERLVRVLTNPAIASLLIAAGFLLLMADLYGGGMGVASGVGLGLLAIFFWGHMLAGLAGWEGVGLVLLGLMLLGLEVFVIPGFGIAGIFGLAASVAGLFLSLIGGEIVTDEDIVRAGATVGFALLAILAGVVALLWLLPKTVRFNGLVLRTRLGERDARSNPTPESGLVTTTTLARDAVAAEPRRVPAESATLVGAVGVAVSDLRPGGIARIGDRRVDVVTQGDYLSAGEPIEVIADEGYRRVVRRLEREKGEATHRRPES